MIDPPTPELTEDIEIIGPGTMLREGREKCGYSQQQVAEKLNFRKSLVDDLENERFGAKVPTTFTRGYLKNYAKLVDVPVDEVLASFEMLGVAKVQGAEMQSFSRQTEKQAENSRIMILSYVIFFVLIGLTIVWWFQEKADTSSATVSPPKKAIQSTITSTTDVNLPDVQDAGDTKLESSTLKPSLDSGQDTTESQIDELADEITPSNDVGGVAQQASTNSQSASTISSDNKALIVFHFAGDCWVNIFDSTGERIAWGIKKADYVMTITGIPPFTITLGKPDQVAITYNEKDIDMTRFEAGHIAKFELPLNE